MESLKKVIDEIMPNLSVQKTNWVKYFEQHQELKDYFQANNIQEEVILNSLNLLYQYTNEKNNCKTCPGIDKCPNLLQGHFTHLGFENNQINSHVQKCDKLLRKEKKEYQQRLFHTLYISNDVLKASFKEMEQTPEREKAFMALLKFCANYKPGEKSKGIYLYGPLGVGKSHLMAAAANKLAAKGISTLMVYVPDFFREMKNSIHDHSLNEKVEALKQVEVLILDDIGAENISKWERDEILGAILQSRMITGLPTLYTSNFNYDDLEEHLAYSNKGGEEGLKAKRVMERIRHYTVAYFVDGPNRRI